MVTLADIQKNEDIKALISAGNRYLAAMGFTEHGPRHVSYVSRTAAGILAALNFSPREVELTAIAGWVHDVGNSVNRHDHGPLGAVLLLPILRETGMAMDDVMEIIPRWAITRSRAGSSPARFRRRWRWATSPMRTKRASAAANLT